jgi:hypothetical protein
LEIEENTVIKEKEDSDSEYEPIIVRKILKKKGTGWGERPSLSSSI